MPEKYWNYPEICLRASKDMPDWYQIYLWDINKIWDMPEICSEMADDKCDIFKK